MNLPWVSRRAYDILVGQVVRLEAQNDKLIDDLTRQRRFEAGMAETPRPERKAAEVMPYELRQWLKGWASPAIQKMQRNQAYRRYSAGEKWSDIADDMMREDEGLNLAEDHPPTTEDTDGQ